MASLSLYLVTFNCGRCLVQPEVFASHLFDVLQSEQDPDMVILCLQEIAPIAYSFLGGSFLTPYFNGFRKSIKTAKNGYINVISRNIGMTAIMVFAKEEVAANVSWLQTAAVGLGLYEMGNKGAVGVRLGYEETELCFVSAHLAPMEDALDRRNEDFQGIVRRLVFIEEPKLPGRDETAEQAPLLQRKLLDSSKSGMYQPGCHLFFAGDLNYRTSSRPPTSEDVKTFPQPRSNADDARHFSHLLAKDQLTQQINEHKTLHGLHETKIAFPPTYKYHPRKPVTLDSEGDWRWATHRWPSWCDRIFYSSTNVKPLAYKALPLFGTSDHRPVALALTVPLQESSGSEESTAAPFPIDADWKVRRDAARRKEIAVGFLAYLTLTWEGNGLLLATIVGATGGWLIIRSMLTMST